jgi:toxin ParE1/3/4
VDLAERYLDAVDATCLRLVDHRQSGAPYDSGIAGLNGLRRVPVRGFENYLLFYVASETGIDVIRVIHGARDLDRFFAQEGG